MRRWLVFENAIALVILATVAFLGYPALAKSFLMDHCGCPAAPEGCDMPCISCCDVSSTPDVEKCPCQENPTHGH